MKRRNTLWKAVIAIVIAITFIGVGFTWYEDYHKTQLENGAYKYLEHELYGDFSDLEVLNVSSVDDGLYEVEYTYTRGGGEPIHATNYSVKL